MRAVVQRVRKARVEVGGEVSGKIGRGIAVLVGIHENDGEKEVGWMCRKIIGLRIFNDDEGKMNKSVEEVEGELLVVSQFTLYGDAGKGNRPSYREAADTAKAEMLYDRMIEQLKKNWKLKVETGEFGASMDLYLHNEGPVTIILEK